MLPIASLALIPFYAGAIAPYTKGNVIKTVLVLIPFLIPYMYFSTWTADVHTAAFDKLGLFTDQIEAGTQLASWDMGGDPVAFVIISIFRLFGFSV
jgi:PTS system galactitol-specific IIC component